MGEERLPQRVMFGELVGGKDYSGGQEKDWMAHLKEDMLVFGMKFEGWRKAAQKAGRWFRRVEEGAELFMQKWHETQKRKAAARRAKAAAAPSTVVHLDTSVVAPSKFQQDQPFRGGNLGETLPRGERRAREE